MQTEPPGRLLARTLVPYVQLWAERSGFSLLSRLLLDNQVREIIERYGDELATYMVQVRPDDRKRQGRRRNGRSRVAYFNERVGDSDDADADTDADTLTNLQARVQTMEAQQQAVVALLEGFQIKIRPLALALGSCPDCFVGVDGCPTCLGRSNVAHFEPDVALLQAHVVGPLAARGVPLVLLQRSDTARHSTESTTRTRTRRGRSLS